MNLYHYFSARTRNAPLKSTYEIGDGDGNVLLRPTGRAVKVLRFLRKNGFVVPLEMNGQQVKQYTVELRPDIEVVCQSPIGQAVVAKMEGGAK